ncbi:MAG: FHA domain-containing protein [Planctomycetes bacterium]|nr:FHA domain-containing protein [Planctomycetota bacterium]
MEDLVLIRGVEGMVDGEVFPLRVGQSVSIGRSRGCEICLKRCKKYADMPEDVRRQDEEFLSVSRKHVRITFAATDNLEVEDLSTNGTYIDGERLTGKSLISDIRDKSHDLRLGMRERFKLEWGNREAIALSSPGMR